MVFLSYLISNSLPTWSQIHITSHFRHRQTEVSSGWLAPWSLTPGRYLAFVELSCVDTFETIYSSLLFEDGAEQGGHLKPTQGERPVLTELKPKVCGHPAAGVL